MTNSKINSEKPKKQYVERGVKFGKRKDGYFIATIFVEYKKNPEKPKKRHTLSATSESAMRKKIREFLSQKENVNTLYTGTFKEYALEWLHLKRERAVRSGKTGGYNRLEYSLNNYIFPCFSLEKLTDITSEELQLFVNNYGKNYSKSSTNKVLEPLKSIFLYAFKNGHIAKNPALLLHGLNNDNYGVKTKITSSLNKTQIEDFEKLCKSTLATKEKYKYHLGYAFILLLNTGLRRGEVIALRWSDVDFEKKRIYVHNSIVLCKNNKGEWEEVMEKPKTKSSERMIPLNNKAIDALKHLKEMHSNSEWVIATHEGNRVSLTNFNQNFTNMLVKNNKEAFGIHVLRHPYVKHTLKILLSIFM